MLSNKTWTYVILQHRITKILGKNSRKFSKSKFFCRPKKLFVFVLLIAWNTLWYKNLSFWSFSQMAAGGYLGCQNAPEVFPRSVQTHTKVHDKLCWIIQRIERARAFTSILSAAARTWKHSTPRWIQSSWDTIKSCIFCVNVFSLYNIYTMSKHVLIQK